MNHSTVGGHRDTSIHSPGSSPATSPLAVTQFEVLKASPSDASLQPPSSFQSISSSIVIEPSMVKVLDLWAVESQMWLASLHAQQSVLQTLSLVESGIYWRDIALETEPAWAWAWFYPAPVSGNSTSSPHVHHASTSTLGYISSAGSSGSSVTPLSPPLVWASLLFLSCPSYCLIDSALANTKAVPTRRAKFFI